MNELEQYIIGLIRAEMHDRAPEPIPEGITDEEIMDFAVKNKVDNLVYRSLSRLDAAFAEKYQEQFYKTIWLESMQQLELESIIEQFSKHKIAHVPMKGSYLKNEYPMPDMRQQGDIDVLVHKKDMLAARQILLDLGYTFKEHDAYEGHDVFYKGKAICMELHGDLLKPIDIGFRRFHWIWKRAIPREGNPYCYDMPKEDFYIYMMLHLIKHLTEGGAGIRMLIDIWLMDEKWGESLNYSSIEEYAETMGVRRAFDNIREIAGCWFGERAAISENAQRLSQYILQSDIYGSKDEKHFIEYSRYKGIAESPLQRGKDMFSRVFKRYNLMRKEFDILNKYPWLLPVMWVYRIFRIVFLKKEKISNTIHEYENIDQEKLNAAISYEKEIKKIVGVD